MNTTPVEWFLCSLCSRDVSIWFLIFPIEMVVYTWAICQRRSSMKLLGKEKKLHLSLRLPISRVAWNWRMNYSRRSIFRQFNHYNCLLGIKNDVNWKTKTLSVIHRNSWANSNGGTASSASNCSLFPRCSSLFSSQYVNDSSYLPRPSVSCRCFFQFHKFNWKIQTTGSIHVRSGSL